MPPTEGLSHHGHEMTPPLARLISPQHIAFEDLFKGVTTHPAAAMIICKILSRTIFLQKEVDWNYILQNLKKENPQQQYA